MWGKRLSHKSLSCRFLLLKKQDLPSGRSPVCRKAVCLGDFQADRKSRGIKHHAEKGNRTTMDENVVRFLVQ